MRTGIAERARKAQEQEAPFGAGFLLCAMEAYARLLTLDACGSSSVNRLTSALRMIDSSGRV